METERGGKTFTAPYFAWKTLFNLLVRLEESGLPDQIDRTYLSNLSGTEQSYLMSAMRTFGLIGEKGKVLEPLKELASGSEARIAGIRTLLETHYPDAVALPANATQGQLDEVFRSYNVGGERLRKAETFFLRAAHFAGLKLSSNFKSPTSTEAGSGPSRPAVRRSRRSKVKHVEEDEMPAVRKPPADTGITVNVHPMLSGSIQWLAENGSKWTGDQQEAWIKGFEVGVRLVYPAKKAAAPIGRRESPKEDMPGE
jgi:hypothetical protein